MSFEKVVDPLPQELPGQTLNATALMHEAYLRLVGESDRPQWDSRGHFFTAAAESMRRILVEAARRRLSQKRGGTLKRREIDGLDIPLGKPAEEVVAVSKALDELGAEGRRGGVGEAALFRGLRNA